MLVTTHCLTVLVNCFTFSYKAQMSLLERHLFTGVKPWLGLSKSY